jgi:2-oxo-3-hexenedioate decarboxylase
MDAKTSTFDINAVAAEVIAAADACQQIAPFTSRPAGLTADDALRVLPLIRAAFEARGETIVGRKIGFTNRSIWPQYGVYAPIWGYVTDRTARELAATPALSLAALAEPRIEPEIIFGLARAPAPNMDDAAILDCIDWVALGYEVVQSIYPGWTFQAPDTLAANGLHGALMIGPRHKIAPAKAEWLRTLSTFTLALACDGKPVERGGGANVLEGPLSTIRHLAALLADDPHNPPLAAGEIVSTGTLTRAYPVKPGEVWTATPDGIRLGATTLRFV